MYIEQLYTNCLAEAAYYIESEGEAAIIDPIRETAPYTDKLSQRKAQLKYVFETHFHADFVSGHIDLANKTGATIVYGPVAETNYKTYTAKDGEEFKVGKLIIRVLHTPGHTPESTCYLLLNESGKPHSVFTGDTLFVGDVGRPDLLDGKMSKEELAGMMYESLNNKIKVLPDEVIVYPGHGAGSACGKNIGKETWSTIGEQKKNNYALQDISKSKFIEVVTDGLVAPPHYFFKDAMINKTGYDNIDTVMSRNTKALTSAEVKTAITQGALVLDTRNADDFEKGFIKGAINIGLNGTFAVWVGTLIDITTPLIVVAEDGKEKEAILRLARVGYENVKGFLQGGITGWRNDGNPVETITSITPQAFAAGIEKQPWKTLDVRKSGEYDNGYVKGAQNLALADLNKQLPQLDKGKTYAIYCGGGYRSMVAASLMKANGFQHIINIYGGFEKIKATGVPVEQPVAL